MKQTQSQSQQINLIKKQPQGQLKQLIEGYFMDVGTDMWPILQTAFDLKYATKENTNHNEQKAQQRKRRIQCGKIVLLSSLAVLLFTMIGLFEYRIVLVFGVVWGFVFTKYEMALEHELMQMLLYWMVLGLLSSLQDLIELGLFFMPFYHSLKLFFIISLLYPKTNLKHTMYRDYFLPRISALSQTLSSKK